MKKISLAAIGIICAAFACQSVTADEYSTQSDQITLAVTNTNTAMVSDVRTVQIPSGQSTLRVTSVPSYLVPESVNVQSKTSSNQFKVSRQRFVPGPVAEQDFLASLEGKTVLFSPDSNSRAQKAKLITALPVPILETSQGIVSADSTSQITVPKGTSEMMDKAGLVWDCQNSLSGEHKLELTYLCTNINWQADYVVSIDENQKTADITGWLTVTNATDTDFNQARLNIFTAPIQDVSAPLFESNGLLKQIPGTFDLKSNSSVQINLFENSQKPLSINRIVISDLPAPQDSSIMLPVEILYTFPLENAGMLPAGDVRIVNKNNTPMFLTVPLSVQDGNIEIPAGTDPRIQVQRTVTVEVDENSVPTALVFDCALLNVSSSAVKIMLAQKTVPGTDIVNPGKKFEKTDAQTVVFNLDVEPNSQQTLHYKLKLPNQEQN